MVSLRNQVCVSAPVCNILTKSADKYVSLRTRLIPVSHDSQPGRSPCSVRTYRKVCSGLQLRVSSPSFTTEPWETHKTVPRYRVSSKHTQYVHTGHTEYSSDISPWQPKTLVWCPTTHLLALGPQNLIDRLSGRLRERPIYSSLFWCNWPSGIDYRPTGDSCAHLSCQVW